MLNKEKSRFLSGKHILLFATLLLAGTANAQSYNWALNVGGGGNDVGFRITIDTAGSGDVYVTGYFIGTADFDPSGNTANLSSNGGEDIFVAKYDANGNYLWAFNVGGVWPDIGYGIVCDPAGSGDVYVTGSFRNTVDFDPGPGIANLTSNAGSSCFVAKYDANGNYLWAFKVEDANGYDIATDPSGSGDVYVTGTFSGTTDFDPGPGVANLTLGGGFLAKYDVTGNYLWAFKLGTTPRDIATDTAGSNNVYVTGGFGGTIDFDPSGNTANLTSNNNGDVFVAKYDANGNYQWAFNIGGTTIDDYGFGITTDPAGNGDVYVTGIFRDTADFDPSANTANLAANGTVDIFVAKYDANGNYQWAFNIGGERIGIMDMVLLPTPQETGMCM